METFAVVLVTAGSAAEADLLAETLVREGLAACVQATPVVSRYAWKGELVKDDELLLLVKTRQGLFEPLAARVRQLHSYETPEIVMLAVGAGDAGYLAWLEASTRPVVATRSS